MKKIVCLALFAILLVSFASCGTPPSTSAGHTVRLQYWTYDEIYKFYMEDCVRRYNETSEIKIELETSIFSMDGLDNKLWASLQAGIGAPDIVDLEQSRFGRYMNPKNNYLTPLNTIIDSKKEEVVELAYRKYQDKGFYYGLDYYENNAVIFYNLPLLQKAGVNPANIKTFGDFRAAGRRLMEQSGIPLLTVDYTDDIVFESLLASQGGGYCNALGEVSVAEQASVQVLESLQNMIYTENIAAVAPSGDFFSYEFYNYFNSGQAAAVIAPFWYSAYMYNYMPDLRGDIYVAPLPMADEQGSGVQIGGIATAIPIKSAHSILIKNLLRSTRMSVEGCEASFKNLFADPIVPATYAAGGLAAISHENALFANESTRVLQQIRQDAHAPNMTKQYYEIADLMRSQILFQALKENSITAEEAVTQVTAALENSE